MPTVTSGVGVALAPPWAPALRAPAAGDDKIAS